MRHLTTRSVPGPYMLRIWSVHIDTEKARSRQGADKERTEKQDKLKPVRASAQAVVAEQDWFAKDVK